MNIVKIDLKTCDDETLWRMMMSHSRGDIKKYKFCPYNEAPMNDVDCWWL